MITGITAVTPFTKLSPCSLTEKQISEFALEEEEEAVGDNLSTKCQTMIFNGKCKRRLSDESVAKLCVHVHETNKHAD